MVENESQDAVVESPDETQAESESSPEEQDVAGTEASTDDSEHLEEATEPEAEGEVEPEAAAPEASPEPSTAPQSVVQPFSFAADGKRVEVEGASRVEFLDPEGKPTRSIVVPEDVWQRKIQPYLADRGAFANKERDYKRQLANLAPDKNETVIRAQAILDEFEKVLSTEESLTKFLEGFEQNRELLKLKVDKAATEAKLKARDDNEREVKTEHDTETTVQRVQSDVPDSIMGAAALLKQQYGVEVSEQALRAAHEEIMDNLGGYYRRATPEEAQQYGVGVGEVVRDNDRVLRTVHRFAALLNAGSEQKTKTEEAAKKNQAALGGTKKSPPPSVSAKGSAPPAERQSEIKSFEDFKRVMGGNV